MKKYIYLFNYQENEKDLCALEFRTIFSQPFSSRYYITSQDFDYTRSVYMKGKLTVLYEHQNFDEIIEQLKKDQLTYYNFKTVFIKTETHVDYEKTLECCKRVAAPINGSVNFKEPDILIGIMKMNDIWYVGEYLNEVTWSLRKHKPHSYSHSLNTRDARTLVNLAVGNNLTLKLCDPCCGIGTVVLEALSMGISIKAYDINRWVSYQARLNLEYYGYDPLIVEKKDMHDIKESYDAVIMDIPYGVYTPFTYEEQCSLLKATTVFTHRLVLVTHQKMNQELIDLGYKIIDQTSITKGKFTRYITISER